MEDFQTDLVPTPKRNYKKYILFATIGIVFVLVICLGFTLYKNIFGKPILAFGLVKVKIVLIDAVSGQAISNTSVQIRSDNGVRCIQAPCPTNAKNWESVTDNQGEISIPSSMIQAATSIRTADGQYDGFYNPKSAQGFNKFKTSIVKLYPSYMPPVKRKLY